MKRLYVIFSIALLLTVFESRSDENIVVAKFDGGVLRLEDLKKFQASAPAQVQSLPLDKVFKPLRDQKLIELLLENAKKKANLSGDAEVRKLKEEAAKSIEMQVFLKRAIDKRITDSKLKPLYNELMKKFKGQKEYEVSIIVLDKKADADKAMRELNTGKNFTDVAKKHSVEANTRAQGGRLGFLLAPAIDQVLGADIGKALKILKDNVHSRRVIKKGNKFIIVRRGGSRAATPPSFDTVKPQLKGMYSKKALLEYLQELTQKADIKVFTIDGKPDQFQLKTPAK